MCSGSRRPQSWFSMCCVILLKNILSGSKLLFYKRMIQCEKSLLIRRIQVVKTVKSGELPPSDASCVISNLGGFSPEGVLFCWLIPPFILQKNILYHKVMKS